MVIDAHYHLFKKEYWKSTLSWEAPLIQAGFWKGVGKGEKKFGAIRNIESEREKVDSLHLQPESVTDLVAKMDAEGIDYTVCVGINLQRSWDSYVPNDWLAEQVAKHPDRLIGVASLDPLGGKRSAQELRRCVAELGIRGLKLLTSYEDIHPADPKIFSLYEACVELDIVCQNHTGWSLGGSLVHEDIRLFDQVGREFPSLKYQLVHTGYQSYYLAIMLMLKHPNFWGDLAWWHAFPDSELIRCLKLAKHYCVIDKLMWASDNLTTRSELERFKELPELARTNNISPGLPDLTDEDIDLVLGRNAQRLYKLPDRRMTLG